MSIARPKSEFILEFGSHVDQEISERSRRRVSKRFDWDLGFISVHLIT